MLILTALACGYIALPTSLADFPAMGMGVQLVHDEEGNVSALSMGMSGRVGTECVGLDHAEASAGGTTLEIVERGHLQRNLIGIGGDHCYDIEIELAEGSIEADAPSEITLADDTETWRASGEHLFLPRPFWPEFPALRRGESLVTRWDAWGAELVSWSAYADAPSAELQAMVSGTATDPGDELPHWTVPDDAPAGTLVVEVAAELDLSVTECEGFDTCGVRSTEFTKIELTVLEDATDPRDFQYTAP